MDNSDLFSIDVKLLSLVFLDHCKGSITELDCSQRQGSVTTTTTFECRRDGAAICGKEIEDCSSCGNIGRDIGGVTVYEADGRASGTGAGGWDCQTAKCSIRTNLGVRGVEKKTQTQACIPRLSDLPKAGVPQPTFPEPECDGETGFASSVKQWVCGSDGDAVCKITTESCGCEVGDKKKHQGRSIYDSRGLIVGGFDAGWDCYTRFCSDPTQWGKSGEEGGSSNMFCSNQGKPKIPRQRTPKVLVEGNRDSQGELNNIILLH